MCRRAADGASRSSIKTLAIGDARQSFDRDQHSTTEHRSRRGTSTNPSSKRGNRKVSRYPKRNWRLQISDRPNVERDLGSVQVVRFDPFHRADRRTPLLSSTPQSSVVPRVSTTPIPESCASPRPLLYILLAKCERPPI